MASGDIFDQIKPKEFAPQNGVYNEVPLVTATLAGGLAGVPCNKLGTQGYQFQTRIWNNGTPLTSGVTINLQLVDDPANPGAGLVGKFGVTVKRLAGGGDYTQASASAEVTGTVTMPAVSGQEISLSIAVTKAAISASLAAGDPILVQVRRLGTDAADTHPGRILLTGATIQDT